jgi:hypothetical protein
MICGYIYHPSLYTELHILNSNNNPSNQKLNMNFMQPQFYIQEKYTSTEVPFFSKS